MPSRASRDSRKERDMLAATVQTENSILEVIRKNYQDQWNLQKKDLDKKKQALNEEKNLINERQQLFGCF